MNKWVYFSVIGWALSGCAANLPQSIVQAPPRQPQPEQVQANPDAFVGQPLRWGGKVIEVQNREGHTDVLVLASELEKAGEPREQGQVYGRFIARISGFQEPSLFPSEARVTFSGVLSGVEKHPVGEYPYPYPVMQVDVYHVWPEPRPHVRSPYYDPWPWGYYRGYPGWGYPYWWW